MPPRYYPFGDTVLHFIPEQPTEIMHWDHGCKMQLNCIPLKPRPVRNEFMFFTHPRSFIFSTTGLTKHSKPGKDIKCKLFMTETF